MTDIVAENFNSWFKEHVRDNDIVNAIVRIRLKLTKGQIIERDFRADVHIDYEILVEQLQEAPSMFAFWSMLLSEQKYIVAQLERLLRLRALEVATSARREASEKQYKLTKPEVDDLIDSDDDHAKLWERCNNENRTLSKLYGIIEALRMKSEHLRSLSGFKKQELRDTAGQ